jgi:hypothetical protein
MMTDDDGDDRGVKITVAQTPAVSWFCEEKTHQSFT